MHHDFKRAFTLIELLVVVSIITMMSSVVLVAVQSARDKGRVGAGVKFATYNDHAIGDRVSALWQFNECSGGTSADFSGNKNNITINGASWSTDAPIKPGCSLFFHDGSGDSATSAYIQTAVSQYTISVWIKTGRNLGSDTGSGIVQDRGSDGTGNSITIALNQNSGIDGAPECGLDTNGTYIGIYSTRLVNDNKWHNLTCVFNGVSGSLVTAAQFTLYIDGQKAPTNSVTIGSILAPLSGVGPTTIGYHESWGLDFDGYIDDVRIYKASLTSIDAERIYAEGLPTHSLARE